MPVTLEGSRLCFKYDGTRAETRFRHSAKLMSPFKSAGGVISVEVCASAVVMLDTSCSELVWRVLATHSIRQFHLHFPSRASPCAITFQLDSESIALPTIEPGALGCGWSVPYPGPFTHPVPIVQEASPRVILGPADKLFWGPQYLEVWMHCGMYLLTTYQAER